MNNSIRPFFIRHLLSIILITLILFAICYQFFDIPVAYFFKNSPSYLKNIATAITMFIDPYVNYTLWPVFLFIARGIKAPKNLILFLLLLSMAIPLSNLVNEIPKHILGRTRPELLFSKELFGFTFFKWSNAYLSCPSGHACTSGAFFGILSCYYPKKTLLFLIMALFCAFSRVILEDHYLGDILVGVVLGSIISQTVYWIDRKKAAYIKYQK